MITVRTSLFLWSVVLLLSGNTAFAMYDTASQQPVDTQPTTGWGAAAKEYGVPVVRSAACAVAGVALGTGLGTLSAHQLKDTSAQKSAGRVFLGMLGLGIGGGSLLAYHQAKGDNHLWSNVAGGTLGTVIGLTGLTALVGFLNSLKSSGSSSSTY